MEEDVLSIQNDIFVMTNYEELKKTLKDKLIDMTTCVTLSQEQIDEAGNRGYE